MNMEMKLNCLVYLTQMVFLLGVTLAILPVASSSVIRVPQDYPLIQWAINSANPRDTILVSPGTYNERLVVNQTVNLVGEDRDTTIIDAKGTGTAVSITSPNVNISGFTIRNGEWGIKGGFRVSDNTVEKNDNGILNAQVATDNIVRSNGELFAYGTGYGIVSGGGIIEKNTVYNNFYGIAAHHSVIRNNKIFSNGVGSPGYYYDGSGIFDGWEFNSGSNEITENTIENNYVGFWIWGADNVIYHNNVISNQKQIYGFGSSASLWTNGAEGNYWSDYQGKDGNGDGIGDTLLPHLGVDDHPLMQPWNAVRTFNAFVWNAVTYQVVISSNNTIASFNFNHLVKQISFNVTGPSGKVGYSNVTIPKLLLQGNPWQITVDENGASNVSIIETADEASLYFMYNLTTHDVRITGSEALDIIPPVANAGQNQTVNEDSEVTLDGSGSQDNVGIVNYTWTFQDTTPKTLTGIKPTYTFNTPGRYTVTLNVSDAVGNWNTSMTAITVLDITPPTANAGQNQTITQGTTITLDASKSSDNVGIVSYEWDFGDRTTGTGKTITHTYSAPGTYTVTLTVRDQAGNIGSNFITVKVLSYFEVFPWLILGLFALAGITIGALFFWRHHKVSNKNKSSVA